MHLDDSNLPDYLKQAGLFDRDATLQVSIAGEGNINFVRRVSEPGGFSCVVKQARPALERFPEYRVSTERIVFEFRYGEVVRGLAPEVAHMLPETLHFDAEARILVMSDFGDAPRVQDQLLAGQLDPGAMRPLGQFLGRVHSASAECWDALAPRFANDEMRALHGQHIFRLPFQLNDFPIPSEIREEAAKLLEASGALARIETLEARYYESRGALIHGDVQGTNLLLEGGAPRLLDAEIAHVGEPAFDVGTALAHLNFHIALQPENPDYAAAQDSLLAGYAEGAGAIAEPAMCFHYAGVEMLRRILGAARLNFLQEVHPAKTAIRHATTLLMA